MRIYAIKSYLRQIKKSGRNRKMSVYEIRREHDALLSKLQCAPKVHQEDAHSPIGPYRIFTPEERMYDAVLIHFHGGTLCMGSIASHTPFASHLAHYASAQVFLFEYRLAPEHPYPASFDDAYNFYCYVREVLKIPADKIIISADSGGALLAFSLVHRCHHALKTPPRMLLFFAPAASAEILEQPDLYYDLDERDPLLDTEQIRRFCKAIFGDHPLDDPMVSPMYADYSAFPPFFTVIGSDELLLDSVRFVHIKAVKAGVDCELFVQPGCFHGHFMFPGLLKEANLALKTASRFMHQRLPRLAEPLLLSSLEVLE